MFEFFRREPLYHYPLDRFSIISPFLYRLGHRVVHVGGGPRHNHPAEINLNVLPLPGVDVVGNAERLPLADASVDTIISAAAFEHIQHCEIAAREIERVLKPGGFLYVEIPFIQHYHTHDVHGATFEDYRRLTRTGLAETFRFCTPLDVGVCVGPVSAVLQIAFSFLRDLIDRPRWRRVVKGLYYAVGNLLAPLDARLSDATIRRSTVPSGVYLFGRKRDEHSPWLEQLPRPNSIFPHDVAARIELHHQTAAQIDVRVTNTSHTTWLRESRLPWGVVHVGLQRIVDRHCERDFRRIELPRDVASGDQFDVSIDRDILGHADAALVDLVIEGVCWFAEHGARPLRIELSNRR